MHIDIFVKLASVSLVRLGGDKQNNIHSIKHNLEYVIAIKQHTVQDIFKWYESRWFIEKKQHIFRTKGSFTYYVINFWSPYYNCFPKLFFTYLP